MVFQRVELGEIQKPKILIIEDEEGPREALKQILKNHYKISTARNTSDALKVLEDCSLENPFDLITLDLKLPGTPGSQIIGDIKRLSPDTEVIIISGTGTLDSAIEGIRNGVADFITKPFSVVNILSSVQRALQRKTVVSKETKEQKFQPFKEEGQYHPELHVDAPLLFPLSAISKVGKIAKKKPIDLIEFARVLASTLDGQDRYTHGHCERVAHYSISIAEEYSFSRDEIHELIIAAYLHDIGKIGIDRELVRKQGVLTPSEKILLRSHPQRGVKIVEPLGISQLARAVIRSHHESWDGSGYPDGLEGEQIHVAARIVRVADSYDAMTSDRPYRLALPKMRALDELKKGKGKQYDPAIVDVFLNKLTQLT